MLDVSPEDVLRCFRSMAGKSQAMRGWVGQQAGCFLRIMVSMKHVRIALCQARSPAWTCAGIFGGRS
eukprot:7509909-Alexandrium_andersonii.AAC.1